MKNFYVTLALSAIASYGYCQESCETAIELPVTDSNVTVPEVPSTDGSRYSVWFSFQAPAENDVVLQLKPVGYDSYVMWEGYYECPEESVEPPVRGSGTSLLVGLKKGTTLKLKSTTYQSYFSALGVTVKETVMGGETCDQALQLTLDEFFVPYNKNGYSGETWVTYEAQETGEITWTTAAYTSIEDYLTCDEKGSNYYSPTYDNGNYRYELAVEAGNQYIWRFNNSAPMLINPQFNTISEGDKITSALEAVTDENTCAGSRKGNHWYKYTPQQDGYLEIKACNFDDPFDGEVVLYNSIDAYYPQATSSACPDYAAGFFLRSQVTADKTYYFNVKTNTAMDDFSFWVNEILSQQGDDCSNPLEAVSNNQCTPNTLNAWYKYTAQGDNYIEIETNGNAFEGSLAIYSDCNTLLYQEYLPVQASSVNGKCKLRFIATANTTYYAKFTLTALNNFSFSLNEVEVQDGDLCTKPIYVTGNTLTLPAEKAGQIVWYSYTSNSEGWLNLSICDPDWDKTTSFAIKESCSDYSSLSYQKQECADGIGTNYRIYTTSGRNLLFGITIPASALTTFVAEISEVEPAEGEVCTLAYPAQMGSNPVLVTMGASWYKFTTEEAGLYTISSTTIPYNYTGNASTIRYKTNNCDASFSYVGYDYQQNAYFIESNFDANTDIYVEVNLTEELYNGTFNISYREPAEGETCHRPIMIQNYTINHAGGYDDVWYSIDLDSDGTIKIGDCENEKIFDLYIYSDCPENIYAYQYYTVYCPSYLGKFLEADLPAGNYKMRMSSYDAHELPISFTSSLNNKVVSDGFSVYPNPAKGYFSVRMNDANENVREIRIVDLSGKEVYRDNHVLDQTYRISTSGFMPGVYIVIISTDMGVRQQKIMIEN